MEKASSYYPQHPRRVGPLMVGMLAVLIVAGLPPAARAQEEALQSLKQTGKAFAAVAREASPAVVFISVEKTVSAQAERLPSPFDDEFLRRFFGQPLKPQDTPGNRRLVVGQGSGFIISPDGYILTNNHVVGEADKVRVKLLDGREFTAKTVGTDAPTDVAVIKIEAHDLPVLSLGDSDILEVGEWVLALGNPFGLSHTLTAGIVSAKGRSRIGISDYEDYIQTDAAINPGNSGGPLINLEGRVVGINTAIFSRSGGYMGIGFAIPVNLARGVYTQLIEHGSVSRGYLGIMIQDLTPDLARSFDLEDTRGALISEVMDDTPAKKAGLKQGDVILSFNDETMESSADLRNRVSMTAPGTRVKITVVRDKSHKTFTVKIGELPAETRLASSSPDEMETLGLTVVTLTAELAEQYGFPGEEGVLVTQVDPQSLAALSGLRPGLLIQEVNRRAVRDLKGFEEALEEGGERPVLLLIRDRQGTHYLALERRS